MLPTYLGALPIPPLFCPWSAGVRQRSAAAMRARCSAVALPRSRRYSAAVLPLALFSLLFFVFFFGAWPRGARDFARYGGCNQTPDMALDATPRGQHRERRPIRHRARGAGTRGGKATTYRRNMGRHSVTRHTWAGGSRRLFSLCCLALGAVPQQGQAVTNAALQGAGQADSVNSGTGADGVVAF